MLAGVLEPSCQVVECLASRNVVDKEGAGSSAVIRPRDGPERLLACCVPNLQLNLFTVDGNHASAEFHADCEIVHGLEALVGELEQQTGLADTWRGRERLIIKTI